jgi:preprotein translocase subunit SecB
VFYAGGNFQPSVDLQLNTDSKHLGDNAHEVVLTVTVTGSTEERTAFIVEVKQAAVFGIEGFAGEELNQVLGAYCPSVLFPFAREVVADLVAKGSLPQLVLQPVNFDALYAQHVQQGAGASDASA